MRQVELPTSLNAGADEGITHLLPHLRPPALADTGHRAVSPTAALRPGAGLQETALRLHEELIEAACASDAQPMLQKADVTLVKLRLHLRLCRDLDLLSDGQYEHVSRMVEEIGRLLGGWRKSRPGRESR